MNKPGKIAIIGAGGISCNLAPFLSRMSDLVIVDGDSYEPKNAERQFPALEAWTNGSKKAEVLTSILERHTQFMVDAINDYLTGFSIYNEELWRGVEMVFGAVDNNASRKLIVEICEDMGIPAIMAGNSHEHGEAHMFFPGAYNPFDHFEFPDTEPAPWSCTDPETIEKYPQTPVANMLAAGAAIHIYGSYLKAESPQNMIVHSRLDPFSSTHSRMRDLIDKKP